MSGVELKRADRTHVQVREVTLQLPINPILHFAVVLPGRVRVHHQFNAVPPVQLRLKIRHRFEVRVLIRVSQPLTFISDCVAIRHNGAIRVPVVAPLRSLLRPIDIKMSKSRRGFSQLNHVVLEQEQEESGAVRRRNDSGGLGILGRQPDSVVVGSRNVITRVELLVHPHVHRVLRRTQHLPERAGNLGCADRERKLDRLAARKHVLGFSCDSHVHQTRSISPFSLDLIYRRV